MTDQEQIEEMAKEIARVLCEIRQDITSVIRYIRHDLDKEKELYSNFTLGQFIDRHLKYKQLADETSRNILKNLNENDKLKEIENLCVNIARNGIPKDGVVLLKEELSKKYVSRDTYDAEIKYRKVLEKRVLKETAEKFYDKVNENICMFKLESKSQEFTDGYAQAVADVCGRLDQVAKQFGVEIKE